MENDYSFLPFLLTEKIYVVTDKEAKNEIAAEENVVENKSAIKYFGQNKSKTVIVVSYKEGDFLKTKEFDFLLKIMEAVKLTLNEIAVINLANNEEVTLTQIQAALECEKLLLFDVNFPELQKATETDLYTLIQKGNSTYLNAHNLTAIREEVAKKKLLWRSLQKMFV